MKIENKIMNLMDNIEYGWVDKFENKHLNINKNFSSDYILQTPKEVINNKVGVCWDQVELERYYFNQNKINTKTYFLVHYDGGNCPTHTFLAYSKDNKYYWFEHSWEKFKGIHEYSSLNDLFLDVQNKFIKTELNNNYDSSSLVLHEYKKPKYHISVQDFYNHCDNGKYIDLLNEEVEI